MNGTDIIIRRLKRLLQQYAPGLDQGLSNTQSPNTLITALKRILKSQQALAASSQDARHAELLNRLFDHINDGIEDIGELESLLKGLKSLGNIPPLLMDALKGAVGDWLAQECEGLSPNQSRDLISQVNTLAKQTIGEDLVSSEDPFTHPSDDPTNPTPIAFTPVSVPMAHMATPYHAPQATQAENNVFHESHQDTPLQRAALFIASITQCMTHHALQIAEEAFEPLLKATQKTTRQNPNEEQKN